MLDRWAFGMSKIENGGGNTPASAGVSKERAASSEADEAARAIGQVSLEPPPPRKAPAGPSLLSQQAPIHRDSPEQPEVVVHTPEGEEEEEPVAPGTAKAMAVPVDEALHADLADASLADAAEHITVKIADLGNGERLFVTILRTDANIQT